MNAPTPENRAGRVGRLAVVQSRVDGFLCRLVRGSFEVDNWRCSSHHSQELCERHADFRREDVNVFWANSDHDFEVHSPSDSCEIRIFLIADHSLDDGPEPGRLLFIKICIRRHVDTPPCVVFSTLKSIILHHFCQGNDEEKKLKNLRGIYLESFFIFTKLIIFV